LERETIIEVSELYKSYKGFEAVKGISFKVFRGDVFGFLGPNGAGKSTTIRMMLDLIRPTSGTIKIFGKSVVENREGTLNKIGAIVEKPDLYGYLSVYDNLELLSRMSGKTAGKQKIMEILELVGLKDRAKSKIKTFSHGMKQRAGIAQALIHDPELIILDEPTTGLDPQGMVEIRDLILKLSREYNKTILLSSHILNEVEIVANRMVIINKGKVAVEGEVEKLLNTDDMKVTVEVTKISEAMLLIKNSEFSSNYRDHAGCRIMLQMKKEQMASLNRKLIENDIDVIAMIPMRSLEEYFLNLT
jgi:ABC-type multidrug transport system ATPase subunit